MQVAPIHITMATRSIFHLVHVSTRTLRSNSPILVDVVMVPSNTERQVVICTPKKAITGILPLLLHAKQRLFV
jgi:hypothetical protein